MIISLFDRTNKIRDAFRSKGYQAYSLDLYSGHKSNKVDFCTDILDWDYLSIDCNAVKFLFIALPCQVYSIASGAFHFKNSIPVTNVAKKHLRILFRVYQITQYFNCKFIIENPSGGLINNRYFKALFQLNVSRLTLRSFGFPTQKKTDLFYNFDMLLLSSPVNRVNSKYQKQKLDNLSYTKRVTYPDEFVSFIVENILFHLN